MLKITQVKSRINRKKDHKATLDALGISRMDQTVYHEDTPAIRGMVHKVEYMLEVDSGRRRGQRIEMGDIFLHNLRPDPGVHALDASAWAGARARAWARPSGRGHKGSKQRSGGQISPRYEGGQMPLHMRLPKLRGPHGQDGHAHRSVPDLHDPGQPVPACECFAAGEVVSPETLLERGIIKKLDERVKILASGELSAAAHHQGPRLQRRRPGEDRSCRRHGGSHLNGVH